MRFWINLALATFTVSCNRLAKKTGSLIQKKTNVLQEDADTIVERKRNEEAAKGTGESAQIAELNVVASDPRWGSCEVDAQGDSCQEVRINAIRVLHKEQMRLESLLTRSEAGINFLNKAMEGRRVDVQSLEEAINGDGTKAGLLLKIKQIGDGLAELNTSIKGQGRSFKDQVKKQTAQLSSVMESIDKNVDIKLTNLEKAAQKLIKDQTKEQSDAIASTSRNFSSQVESIKMQSEENAEEMEKILGDQGKNISDFKKSSKQQISNMQKGLDNVSEEVNSLVSESKKKVQESSDKLNRQAETTVADLKAKSQSEVEGTKKKFNAIIEKDRAALQNDLNEADAKLREKAEAEERGLKAEVEELDSESKREARNADAQRVALSNNMSSAIQSIQEDQGAAEADGIRMAEDNKKALEEAVSFAKDSSGQAEQLASNAKENITQMSSKLRKDVAGSEKRFGKQISNEFTDIVDDIQSLEDESADLIKQNGDELKADINGAKETVAQTGKNTSSRVDSATKAVDAMGQVVGKLIRVGSQTEQDRLGEVGKNLGEEITELQDLSSQVGQAGQSETLHMKSDLADLLQKKDSATNDRFNKMVTRQEKDLTKLDHEATEEQGERSREISSVGSTVRNVDETLENELKDLKDLSKHVADAKSRNKEDLTVIDQQVALSKDMLEQSTREAKDKANTDATGLLENEKVKLAKKDQDFNDAFDEQVNRATRQTRSSYAEVNADAQKIKANLVDAQIKIDDTDKDLNDLTAQTEGKFRSVETQMGISATKTEQKVHETIEHTRIEADKLLHETQKKSNERIEKEAHELSERLDESYEKSKSSVTELMKNVVNQTKVNAKFQSEASSEAAKMTISSENLKHSLATASGELTALTDSQNERVRHYKDTLNQWSVTIQKDLSAAMTLLRSGLRRMPTLAAEKVSHIQAAMRETKDAMREYLLRFEKAVEEYREAEYTYKSEQAVRMLSALLGINQAMLVGKNGILSELVSTEIRGTESARKLSIVLSGLADSIFKMKQESNGRLQGVEFDLSNMSANSKALFQFLKDSLRKELQNLDWKMNSWKHTNEDAIHDIDLKSSSRMDILRHNVDSLLEEFDKNRSHAGYTMGQDKKNIYALSGLIHSLGDETKLQLRKLLSRIRSGELSLERALALSGVSDTSQIKTVGDVVKAFVTVVESYMHKTQAGFTSVNQEVAQFKTSLGQFLEESETHLVQEAHHAQVEIEKGQEKQKHLNKRTDDFGAKMTKELYDAEEERSAMEDRQEEELHEIQGNIKGTMNTLYAKQKATQRQVSTWMRQADEELAGVISDVGRKIEQAKSTAAASFQQKSMITHKKHRGA